MASISQHSKAQKPVLSIVIPCFNEEAVLPETAKQILAEIHDLEQSGKVAASSHILLVDDGSTDNTWQLIETLVSENPKLQGLKLSGNRGHQIALIAGLSSCDGDIVISIDADLQDDLGAMEKMIDAHAEGADIVFGVRSSRQSDTVFKRWTAESYYKILKTMGVDIVFNHADYRLMSRRALDALLEYDEANLFIRGLIPKLGFPTAEVEYERRERFAGESKYPLGKMISLALSGVTSFSIGPLRLITILGLTISLISFGFGIWSLCTALFFGHTVSGWASTVVPLFFLGGIQLVSLGVMGEYIGRIYLETKRRPRFHTDVLLKHPEPHATVEKADD